MKTKFLGILSITLFCLAGIPGTAFALEECPDRKTMTLETNSEYLKKANDYAAEALEHAKQGHGDETKASTKEALAALKCIVTSNAGAQLQRPKARLKMGGIKAGKGNMEESVKLLEEGVEQMKKVDLSVKGF